MAGEVALARFVMAAGTANSVTALGLIVITGNPYRATESVRLVAEQGGDNAWRKHENES